MNTLLQGYEFVQANSGAILGFLFGLWAVAEAIVRITPTKKDDTALERVGKVLKAGLDAFGIPNRRVVTVETKPVDDEKTLKIPLPGGDS